MPLIHFAKEIFITKNLTRLKEENVNKPGDRLGQKQLKEKSACRSNERDRCLRAPQLMRRRSLPAGGSFSFPLLPELAAKSIPRRGPQRKLCLSSSFITSLSATAFAGEAVPLHTIRCMFNVYIHSTHITSQPSLGLMKRLRP